MRGTLDLAHHPPTWLVVLHVSESKLTKTLALNSTQENSVDPSRSPGVLVSRVQSSLHPPKL